MTGTGKRTNKVLIRRMLTVSGGLKRVCGVRVEHLASLDKERLPFINANPATTSIVASIHPLCLSLPSFLLRLMGSVVVLSLSSLCAEYRTLRSNSTVTGKQVSQIQTGA